jgi:hypothetical protein
MAPKAQPQAQLQPATKLVTPKTRRGRRALEKKAPKAVSLIASMMTRKDLWKQMIKHTTSSFFHLLLKHVSSKGWVCSDD